MRPMFTLPTGPKGAPVPCPVGQWLRLLVFVPPCVFYGWTTSLFASIGVIFAVEATGVQPAASYIISATFIGVIGVITAILNYRQNRDNIRMQAERFVMESEAKARENEASRREREADAERQARKAEADRRERMHDFDNKLNHYRLENEELRQQNGDLRGALMELRSMASHNQQRVAKTEEKVEQIKGVLSDSQAMRVLTPGEVERGKVDVTINLPSGSAGKESEPCPDDESGKDR